MKKIVSFGIFVGAVLSLSAADYYVDSDAGDDENGGRSSERPWRSLEKVNSALGPEVLGGW